MDAIKFTLGGKTAFFKKPDVNSYFYFSYNMIHKVALLGIFGAVLGYGGYNRQRGYKQAERGKEKEKLVFPEFYERLKHLKIAIVPRYHDIEKKIQIFNNSVGYASKEQGGNLIVKEQWLENPKWDIYIALDSSEAEFLKVALQKRRFVYIPYLGKNDHPADIFDVEFLQDMKGVWNPQKLDSLFASEDFEITFGEEDYMSDALWDNSEEAEGETIFKFEEKLPWALDHETNSYILKSFFYTNVPIRNKRNTMAYLDGEKTITFI